MILMSMTVDTRTVLAHGHISQGTTQWDRVEGPQRTARLILLLMKYNMRECGCVQGADYDGLTVGIPPVWALIRRTLFIALNSEVYQLKSCLACTLFFVSLRFVVNSRIVVFLEALSTDVRNSK